MQFIDLQAQQERIRPQLDTAIKKVLDHGQYIMGPEVFELEARLADYVGVKHCVSCASGTDALLMALMAYGVGPGDAIFTTPFTFVATGEVISLLGATPVFVDIDPRAFNLDPQKLEDAIVDFKRRNSNIERPLVPRGIIPVDLFGLPADYDAIQPVAQKHGLFVLEDAAQSFGAVYKGRQAGRLAEVAATSFFPAKPLGCYGDGGAIFTDNDEIAESLRSIRVHGKGADKYDNVRIGVNGRMDTIQAAILLEKLKIFPEEIVSRQKVAATYTKMISAISDQGSTTNGPRMTAPQVPEGYQSAWAQFSILVENRPHLQEHLKEQGIPTAVYYPQPLHLQTAYAGLAYSKGDFPVAENISEHILSLPMYPSLSASDQKKVVENLKIAIKSLPGF